MMFKTYLEDRRFTSNNNRHVATGNAWMGAVQKSNLHRLRMDYESTIKRNLIMLTNDDL